MFKSLAALFGVFIVHNFFSLAQLTLADQFLAVGAFLLSEIFFNLTLLSLIFVLEMFEKNTPFSARVMVFTALAAAIIGAILSNPPLVTEQVGVSWVTHFVVLSTVRVLELVFGSVTAVWFLVVLIRSRKVAKSPAQKHLIVWFATGIFLALVIGGATPQLFDQFHGPLGQIDPEVISRGIAFLGSIGMFIVGWAFYRVSKNPWLLQRQQVHLLIVISEDGLDLFSKIFRPDISPDDVTLLTGGFTAVSSMFKEATKSSGQLQAVLFEGKEMRLLRRQNFTTAILVDYSTQASDVALLKFTEDFDTQFGPKLVNFSGNVSQLQPADEIAEKYFS